MVLHSKYKVLHNDDFFIFTLCGLQTLPGAESSMRGSCEYRLVLLTQYSLLPPNVILSISISRQVCSPTDPRKAAFTAQPP